MTPKCSECRPNSFREPFLCENGDCKSSLTDPIPSSKSLFSLAVVDRMCSISARKKDGHVYKRRKMEKDPNGLVASKESTTRHCASFEDNASLLQNPIGMSPMIPLNAISNSMVNNFDPSMEFEGPSMEFEGPAEASNDDRLKDCLEPHCGVNDKLSSSVASMPSLMMVDKMDAAECSSLDINSTEHITEFTSARELCILVLKKDGLLSCSRTRVTTEDLHDNNVNCLLVCKTCGHQEHPLNVLICDSCEAAFHLSCCIPPIKEVPTEEWYCLRCLRKKPRSLYGKLLNGKGESSERTNKKPHHGISPIEYMLKATEPYVTGVRIGRDFQAEVPEWSGPSSSTDGYFDEPSELDPIELANLNWWKNQSKPSIGNWIQCREVIDGGDIDEPVVCGKWRRAPLFVVQSDNWDCSCCVLWDPIHADCAVPQELETDQVLTHLKYVNLFKNRLVGRDQKPA